MARDRAQASFHNASLYEALRPSIGALVSLLADGEEKTRANAAGALGNLIRNSSALATDLVRRPTPPVPAGPACPRRPCPRATENSRFW